MKEKEQSVVVTELKTKIENIKSRLKEIEKEKKQLKFNIDLEYFTEQGLKLWLNSSYGAFGNDHFFFKNKRIAEAITSTGKIIITETEKFTNDYFLNRWHLDTETHQKLGIVVSKPVKNPIIIYAHTDSFSLCTEIKIRRKKFKDDNLLQLIEETLSIETLYNQLISEGIYPIYGGDREIFHLDLIGEEIEIENWSESKGLHWTKIKKLFRHRVTKPKWEIISESGKKVIITNDHSVCVLRNNKKISIKSSEINKDTDLLIIQEKELTVKFENIKSVKQIGFFENEWVYDIEVEDYSHTFFGQGILLHNSNYLRLDEVLDSCGYLKGKSEKEISDFILKLDNEFLQPMYEKFFFDLTKKLNLEPLFEFESEQLCRVFVPLGNNINIKNVIWQEGEFFDDAYISVTGGSSKSSSTPELFREMLKKFNNIICDHKKPVTVDILVDALRKAKKRIEIADIDEISQTTKVSNYNKYVINDKEELKYKKGTPFAVKAAALYNFHLNKNKHLLGKYSFIYDGKVKIYLIKGERNFAYNLEQFPIEFALKPDRNLIFEKFLLKPINKIIKSVLKEKEIPNTLINVNYGLF